MTADVDRAAALRTAVALLNLPVLVDDTTSPVLIHLTEPITAESEARLLNVVAHLCPSYSFDPIAGPERVVRVLPEGWKAEFVARHPEYAGAF